MKSGPLVHAAAGAIAAMLPDIALATFVWRRRWIPDDHPAMRAHRWLHQPESIGLAIILAWASHLIVDRYTEHRTSPTERGRRGWRW